MRVLFYSPYLPNHFGGGEKHIFDIAKTVSDKHEVFVAIPSRNISHENSLEIIREKYERFLNYDLHKINFISSNLKDGSIFKKIIETKNYDYLYYVTDGSFFISAAKKNNLHIQIPFTNSLSIWEKFKLNTWQIKNCNSEFTKNVVQNSWSTKINFVHYPLVSLEEIKPNKKKEKIILNVGRFFRQLHSKRQDVLVDLFKELIDSNKQELADWKLILVGSVEDQSYFDEVNKLAKGYKIEIKTNVNRDELVDLYKRAKIYWHATGFGVDEALYPEKVEHFGITTIEAMAAGCIPIVINKGGQTEILGSDLNELLWNSKSDCLAITMKLISDENIYKKFQKISLDRVKRFSKQEFDKVLWEMFK